MNSLYLEDPNSFFSCLLNGQSDTIQKYLTDAAVPEAYLLPSADNASLSSVSTVSSTSSIASSNGGSSNLTPILIPNSPIYVPNNQMIGTNLYNNNHGTGSSLLYQPEMSNQVDSTLFPWIGKQLTSPADNSMPDTISNLVIDLGHLKPTMTGLLESCLLTLKMDVFSQG